jgi:diguanylate cyclase
LTGRIRDAVRPDPCAPGRTLTKDPILIGLFALAVVTTLWYAVVPADVATQVIIDLDDFKLVNDDLGHHLGDALLVAVGQRLRTIMRPTDTVVRLGGDEFAVLLPGADSDAGKTVAARITQAFAEPVLVDGHRLGIKASIGVADGELDPSGELLRRADEAMYAAKRGGKGAVAMS